eukprot:TRINITY_DN3984_c0_g2_i1.p1 TRINITY_DN3984_c0_g2~~TRINITY_DN3984_c0_g2_i1.p1  ORF type:complete len:651 (+),score=95.41 TRINITY_DN3984_c0_g2_i1:75-2027(+)
MTLAMFRLVCFLAAQLAADAAFGKNTGANNEDSCPVDHTGLLSPATTCCYQKLVKNPNCCMDEHFRGDIRWREIERPGTQWFCNTSHNCYDALGGNRGKDLMAIPKGADCSSPRILYVHGGSWMYGSPNTTGYGQFASRLATATGAVVFMIDYPLVPVGNYTTILNRSIEGLRWLARHGPDDSCSEDAHVPLVVGGDSSGGGTALSLLLQLQNKPDLLPGRQITGAFLFSPWTNLMCNTPEYYTNAFAKIQSPQTFKDLSPLEQFVGDIIFQSLTEENAGEFSANALEYVGYKAKLQTDPIASPYFAEVEDYKGKHLPALHIAVGGSESIMGDSVRVAYKAAEAGLDVDLEIYNGMWHVFPMYSEGCGSGSELWSGTHAISTTGRFVRSLVSDERSMRSSVAYHAAAEKHFPRVQLLYDPKVDAFSRVGELMPNTAAWNYGSIMKKVSEQPWWVVLPSLGGGAMAIFMAGIFVGGVLDFGGREAYKRAKRVAEYRRSCVEVPIGYINMDAITSRTGQGESRLQRSFVMDFVMGVPEDVHNAWRVETVRAKNKDDLASIDAARAENAAWRRMAMPGYEPPAEVPKVEEPVERLESAIPTSELLKELGATEVAEAWAVATTEAKDGGIEAARRENMAWRLQHIQSKGSGPQS